MVWRGVLVCAALLSIFTGAALGVGEYQRTRDGKTLIWNADPKSDDSASWWGERDKNGYAKGVGELTWYNADGSVYARYYGNTVHGKFDGPVNVHVKGRTAHAFFVDGKRMTGWARGPASSRFATDWRSALAREKADAVPATSPPPPSIEPVSASEELRSSGQQTQESPAEGPAGEGEKKKEDLGKAKFAPANLSTRADEGAGKAEENVQRSTPNVQRSTNQPSQTRSQTPENREQPASRDTTPSPNESRLSSVARRPPANTPHPSPAATQEQGSLAELAAPPASLRNEPMVETPSTAPEADLASSPSANAQLTTEEAVAIADSEARARGYDLNQYERPKADYSKVKGKWSLVYDSKNPQAVEESARHFRVTVDDASRKADVNP
jgi:hypothetical protein